jgi:transposase
MELITILNRCHHFRGCLFPLPSSSARLRSAAGKTLRIHTALGISGLPDVRDAAGQLSTLSSKKSRWLPLKRKENLKTEQRFRLRDLLRYNLTTVRPYLLKETFQQLWDYDSPAWARNSWMSGAGGPCVPASNR